MAFFSIIPLYSNTRGAAEAPLEEFRCLSALAWGHLKCSCSCCLSLNPTIQTSLIFTSPLYWCLSRSHAGVPPPSWFDVNDQLLTLVVTEKQCIQIRVKTNDSNTAVASAAVNASCDRQRSSQGKIAVASWIICFPPPSCLLLWCCINTASHSKSPCLLWSAFLCWEMS